MPDYVSFALHKKQFLACWNPLLKRNESGFITFWITFRNVCSLVCGVCNINILALLYGSKQQWNMTSTFPKVGIILPAHDAMLPFGDS